MRMQAYGPYDRYKTPEQVQRENEQLAELHRQWVENTRAVIFSRDYPQLQLAVFNSRRVARQ